MKKYLTSNRGTRITPIEVIRETAATVWWVPTSGDQRVIRSPKVTSYDRWHDTKAEAKEFLLANHRELVADRERWLESSKEDLAAVESIDISKP